MKITKVYTRRGDTGMTDLVGGVRIEKTDIRLEAYGTIDELSSHLGLLVALLPADDSERATLLRIQNNLFNVGTHLATDLSQTPLYPSARLPEGETELLEQRIDQLNAILPEPQGFVLPGGVPAAAQAHVCRTVCRRAERCIYGLIAQTTKQPNAQTTNSPNAQTTNSPNDQTTNSPNAQTTNSPTLQIAQYVNRLSDYLFVLAKIINFNNGVSEILWQNACR